MKRGTPLNQFDRERLAVDEFNNAQNPTERAEKLEMLVWTRNIFNICLYADTVMAERLVPAVIAELDELVKIGESICLDSPYEVSVRYCYEIEYLFSEDGVFDCGYFADRVSAYCDRYKEKGGCLYRVA